MTCGACALAALLSALLSACSTNAIVVAPIVDVPTNTSASPSPIDTLLLEVAHAGADTDLVSETFSPSQTIELSGVPFADDLVIHMTGSVGQSEVAYGRTCSPLAVSATEQPASPHLFFSRSVKFGYLALTPLPRVDGNALPDQIGAGLFIGGVDPASNAPVTAIERFDPDTAELSQIGAVQPRIGAVAAQLGSGTAEVTALVGGIDAASEQPAAYVEIIDPTQPPGSVVAELADAGTARTNLTATALSSGDVLAVGGMVNGAPSSAVDDISLEDGSPSAVVLRATLATPRYNHTATRLGDDEGAPVLVVGGVDIDGAAIPTAELYKPLSEEFSATFAENTMVVPRSRHQAVRMPDNSVLVIGGVDTTGAPTDTLELFSLDAGFVSVGQLPATAGLLDLAVTTLPDGRVLMTGGRRADGDDPLDTAFIASLDPIDGSVDVVATDNLSVPRAGHQATLLCDGTVLISGGTATAVTAERYNPPATGRR